MRDMLSVISVRFILVCRKYKWWIGTGLVMLVLYYLCLPARLFNDTYSTVLQSNDGNLLSASIADDGQWRFPEVDTVPDKFGEALITFEDKRYWDHPGVDLLSLGRAIRQNIAKGRVVSGGSTITMQVIRLSRRDKSRTIMEKAIEIVLATRLEFRYSKKEILALYASHAPFGGNVVGLDAACWRYFGTASKDLSWGEAALLAVLPNSPSLIHPGKNRELLKAKRDRLLDKLRDAGKIDKFTCELSKQESIPDRPHSLPRHARHLLARTGRDGLGGTSIVTTIDFDLQKRTEQILDDHHQRLKANRVFNIAAVVVEVKSGNTLAYVGNVNSGPAHGHDVDVIVSPRSTGSILKPFLYAAMMNEGKILPHTLLPDVPVIINGFAPKNFSRQFDGAVHADQALIRSLNVPAVHMLRDYRYEKFHTLLTKTGMTTLKDSPDHYGLSLILGGAEGTLWDITGMYASMARILNNFFEHPGGNRYERGAFKAPTYSEEIRSAPEELEEHSSLSAASIYLTFDALKEVYRPGEETGWRYFNSSKKIAWKTGTSFGFRDGWAVGVTPRFVVGVWVGNADGEGRPGLTGTDAAAPVMFDIFSQLPESGWFREPLIEMEKISTCRTSGYRVSSECPDVDTILVAKPGLQSMACPHHRTIHLSADRLYQVHSGCEAISSIINVNWFVLPPVQEYYFKSINLSYQALPPFRSDCQSTGGIVAMDMIYPKNNARIFIPRQLDGSEGRSVFELAHRNPATTVFWHLDGTYIGNTRTIHHMELNPGEGKHVLTAVDEEGQVIERNFEVISKM